MQPAEGWVSRPGDGPPPLTWHPATAEHPAKGADRRGPYCAETGPSRRRTAEACENTQMFLVVHLEESVKLKGVKEPKFEQEMAD